MFSARIATPLPRVAAEGRDGQLGFEKDGDQRDAMAATLPTIVMNPRPPSTQLPRSMSSPSNMRILSYFPEGFFAPPRR